MVPEVPPRQIRNGHLHHSQHGRRSERHQHQRGYRRPVLPAAVSATPTRARRRRRRSPAAAARSSRGRAPKTTRGLLSPLPKPAAPELRFRGGFALQAEKVRCLERIFPFPPLLEVEVRDDVRRHHDDAGKKPQGDDGPLVQKGNGGFEFLEHEEKLASRARPRNRGGEPRNRKPRRDCSAGLPVFIFS